MARPRKTKKRVVKTIIMETLRSRDRTLASGLGGGGSPAMAAVES